MYIEKVLSVNSLRLGKTGGTAASRAAENGHIAAIKARINDGLNVSTDPDGASLPVGCARKQSNIDLVQLLTNHGAKLDSGKHYTNVQQSTYKIYTMPLLLLLCHNSDMSKIGSVLWLSGLHMLDPPLQLIWKPAAALTPILN